MDGHDRLAERFGAQRPRLRSVAYRMLGSLSDADDAVQEAWIRLQRSDAAEITNLDGWLTTVVARISLNMLRVRQTRAEDPLEARLPDPVVSIAGGIEPEQELLIADSVGLALLVVLDSLSPPERLAFVLHDVFAVPFPEIAHLIGCTEPAARKLSSRARRRVQSVPTPDTGLPAQRKVVEAFFTAARTGRLDDLVAVLHPDVVLRADLGPRIHALPDTTIGAAAVAARAAMFANPDRRPVPALVNGAAGAVVLTGDRPFSVMGFTVVAGKIAAIDVLADPERIKRLNLASLLADDGS